MQKVGKDTDRLQIFSQYLIKYLVNIQSIYLQIFKLIFVTYKNNIFYNNKMSRRENLFSLEKKKGKGPEDAAKKRHSKYTTQFNGYKSIPAIQ